jgi:hypothetical protein
VAAWPEHRYKLGCRVNLCGQRVKRMSAEGLIDATMLGSENAVEFHRTSLVEQPVCRAALPAGAPCLARSDAV